MRIALCLLLVFILTVNIPILATDGEEEVEEGRGENPEIYTDKTTTDDVVDLLSDTPKSFTENRGQLENGDVRFYDQGGSVWFTDDGVWFNLLCDDDASRIDIYPKSFMDLVDIPAQRKRGLIIKLEFAGCNDVTPTGVKGTDWFSNYYLGGDPQFWKHAVNNWNEIWYNNLWDGIDFRYYIDETGIKYDFILHHGASINDIQIQVIGADEVFIQKDSLVIETNYGSIRDENLFLYQISDGKISPVEGHFIKYGNYGYGFYVSGDYDRSTDLIIDPKIKISTFIGHQNSDEFYSITRDNDGYLYLAGMTHSNLFPTTVGAYDVTYNGGKDIIVIKMDSNLATMVFSTFIGGTAYDYCRDIKLGLDGSIVVVGMTKSSDFPTTSNALNASFNGGVFDAILVRLNGLNSSLIYSTYFGGGDADAFGSVLIDGEGNIFTVGGTGSVDFPTTTNAYDNTYNGVKDIVIVKFNDSGESVITSTFFGNSSEEEAWDIEMDNNESIYICGHTNSNDFPTTQGVFDTGYNGNYDGFIIKFDKNCSSLLASTYIGDSDNDFIISIKLDSSDFLVGAGYSLSANFPTTPGSYDTTHNGQYDGVVLKMNANLSGLSYSTFLGDIDDDYLYCLSTDSHGNAIVTGFTESSAFPTSPGYSDTSFNGGLNDIVLSKLDVSGKHLMHSTFIGGNDRDEAYNFFFDHKNDSAYIAGLSGSNDFPTTGGGYDNTHNGIIDGIILQYSMKNNWSISQFGLKCGSDPVSTIYSKYCNYSFSIDLTSTALIYDVTDVCLTLDPPGIDVQLLWSQETQSFIELHDPMNYVEIQGSSQSINNSYDNWTITFDIIFNWTYPDEDIHDVQFYATSSTLPPAWFNVTSAYRVENDLIFTGTLDVVNTQDISVEQNDLVRGGDILDFGGLTVVYEGTADMYPPSDEYDVTVWDEQEGHWSDSPLEGAPCHVMAHVINATDEDGFSYRINLSGIPLECDITDESFSIRIDAENVTFDSPTPGESIWQGDVVVTAGISITDTSLAGVDGSSVSRSISKDNGSSWSSWIPVPDVESGKSITVKDDIALEEGTENLVKWRARDQVGNGPSESEPFRIWVDTKEVVFSEPYPQDTEVSTSENVNVGITVSDTKSGVDASTVEYSLSTDMGITWYSWTKVDGLTDGDEIKVDLTLIVPNGTMNRIKWRACDIAGNGPKESGAYSINVNIWENPTIPKVSLKEPRDKTIITTKYVELEWELETQDTKNVQYNVLLDTANPPKEVRVKGLGDTSFLIDDLVDKEMYYWTVIPKTEGQSGKCISGIWSFSTEFVLPAVQLLFPENGSSIHLTEPSITLSWEPSEQGKEWTYDVYYGPSTPPGLYVADHNSTSIDVNGIEHGITYYWTIVPIDEYGTYGLLGDVIWSFIPDLSPSETDFGLSLGPVNDLIIKQGETRRVPLTINNTGQYGDSFEFHIEPDELEGQILPEEQSPIDLAAGGSDVINIYISISTDTALGGHPITFYASSVLASENGYNISKERSFTVTVIENKSGGNHIDNDTNDKEESSTGTLLVGIFGIIIALVIFLIILQVIKKRRSLERESQEKAQDPALDAEEVKPGEEKKPGWSTTGVIDVKAEITTSGGTKAPVMVPPLIGTQDSNSSTTIVDEKRMLNK